MLKCYEALGTEVEKERRKQEGENELETREVLLG